MKLLKSLFLIVSLLLSSAVWAEGGSDRALERIEKMREKAEAVVVN